MNNKDTNKNELGFKFKVFNLAFNIYLTFVIYNNEIQEINISLFLALCSLIINDY